MNAYSPAESIKQVSNYFTLIEESVSVGDTNRKYTPSKNAASPGGMQAENTYLTYNISPVGENICDLYNSTINATMNLVLKNSYKTTLFPGDTAALNLLPGCNAPAVWIGFTDAFDSIAAYQIIANGRQIYTQDNAHNESFITSCGTSEAVKKVDIFSKARHKDVWKRADTVKSGAIIAMDKTLAVGAEHKIQIPIKVDLRRFLVLDSIRYLPAFAGNLQIKIKFSAEALQLTPLSLEDIFKNSYNLGKLTSYPAITNKFVPYEEEFTMIKHVDCRRANNSAAEAASEVGLIHIHTNAEGDDKTIQQFTKGSCTFQDTFSYLHCFSLDANIYTELISRYTNMALSFPIKRLDWISMDGSLNSSGKSVFTATMTPLFVNTIYILFKKKANYHSNYENPLFTSLQLNCGAYGNIPAEPESSHGPVFYETCANSMNTNNDLAGFNTDVMRSLTSEVIADSGFASYDNTHFFMGFPTETDFTFMQGMTSNSPITFKLTTESGPATNPESDLQKHMKTFTQKPEIGFLRHACFSIQCSQNGPPKVVIDDYDLSAEQVD